jgi:hypothetical protein
MLLPCENDQAKLDHFSRLACSTNLSKILKSGPPKRRPLDRGPGSRRGVLELVALTDFCFGFLLRKQPSAFLREPFKTTRD